jgi:hypothetical protein
MAATEWHIFGETPGLAQPWPLVDVDPAPSRALVVSDSDLSAIYGWISRLNDGKGLTRSRRATINSIALDTAMDFIASVTSPDRDIRHSTSSCSRVSGDDDDGNAGRVSAQREAA